MARALCALRGVEFRAMPHVGDELLHVERLVVDHVDGIFQVSVEIILRNGRGQDGSVQELGLMLAHVREDGVAIDARHHQIEEDDAVAIPVQILDGLDAVACGVDAESLMPHDRREQRSDWIVVFNDECPGL